MRGTVARRWRTRLAGPLVVLALALAHPAAAAEAPRIRTLDNGLRVVAFETPGAPLVHLELFVPAGVSQEPVDGSGIAILTAQLLLHGTSSRTADAFEAAADRLGGALTASAGREQSSVALSMRPADLETGLELVADAVLRPLFPEAAFERMRGSTVGALLQLRQRPVVVAEDHLWRAVFGDHPYGRPVLGTPPSVATLTREQARAFHRDHWRPDRAVLAVSGDVRVETLFELAARYFGAWEGRGLAGPIAPTTPPARARVRIVDAPEAPLCEIRVGLAGVAHDHPQLGALEVAAELVGGPLGEIASRSVGLAPHLAIAALGEGGLISFGVTAPADSAGAFVRRVLDVLERAAASPPAPAAFARARGRVAGGIELRAETPADRQRSWWTASLHGVAHEPVAAHRARIEALAAADVHEAAGRWLDPRRAQVIAVGPARVLEPLLASLGPVEVAPLVEAPAPRPAAEPPPLEATVEQRRRGRELVDRAIAAHGGLARLRGVRDSWVTADVVLTSRGADLPSRMEQLRKAPGMLSYSSRLADVETRQVLRGDSAWAVVGDSVEAQDEATVRALQQLYASDLPHLLLAAADREAEVAHRGEGLVGERRTLVVAVRPAAAPPRELHLDAETHRLVAVDQRDGDALARRIYRDFRAVSGILWPHEEERRIGEERVMMTYVRSVSLNGGIGDAVFDRPRVDGRSAPR